VTGALAIVQLARELGKTETAKNETKEDV